MKRLATAAWATALSATAIVAAAVVLTPPSPAQSHGASAGAGADPPVAAPAAAGMVIALDPETGEYGMPTPEEMRALSLDRLEQLNRSQEGLVEVHHPDGSVSIDLQGRFQEYAFVRIGPDGRKSIGCVEAPAAAMDAACGPAIESAPAPAVLEEE